MYSRWTPIVALSVWLVRTHQIAPPAGTAAAPAVSSADAAAVFPGYDHSLAPDAVQHVVGPNGVVHAAAALLQRCTTASLISIASISIALLAFLKSMELNAAFMAVVQPGDGDGCRCLDGSASAAARRTAAWNMLSVAVSVVGGWCLRVKCDEVTEVAR
jgi:hypothetical protein